MGTYIGLILLVGVVFVVVAYTRKGRISDAEAGRLLEDGGVIVDVRTDGEFAAGHAEGAVHLPLDQVAAGLAEAVPDKETPLLIHCASGGRSAVAVGIARKAGYTKAYNLGTLARAKGLAGGTE